MAITASPVWHKRIGTHGVTQLAITATDITLDNSYPTGGESVTAANLGLVSIIWAQPASADGYTFEFDHANSKIIAYASAGDPAPSTATISDNDSAATNGVAVYVHVEENVVEEQAQIGHLEFVSPTNADGSDTFAGSTLHVLDDDAAATGGAALFVAPAGAGLYAATAADCHIPLQDGQFVLVTADADPATNQTAVQVYFDEDGTAGARFQAVVVDNADETVTLAQQGWNQTAQTAGSQVVAATDLSTVTTRVIAFGPDLA